MTTAAVAPASTPVVSKAVLQMGWDTYRKNAEPTGLFFGKLCYDYRASSEVVRGGTSFQSTLVELGIPKTTAYFWMGRYEESIGERRTFLGLTLVAKDTFSPDWYCTPIYDFHNSEMKLLRVVSKAANLSVLAVGDVVDISAVAAEEDADGVRLTHVKILRHTPVAKPVGEQTPVAPTSTNTSDVSTVAPIEDGDIPNGFDAAPAIEDDPAPKSNFNKAGTRGFENKETLNTFVRRLRAIVESSPNAPFAKTMEGAFNECDETEVQVVLSHLNQAIERLGEYHAKFDKKFARKKR
jgi:hypothetical protein